MSQREPLIQAHGGYRRLKSFQLARLIYDVTQRFCDGFVDKRSRTHDQMVQAARSGVQNIAEGSQASATSRKAEMKLTGVARASLEELRLDYEDFLRQRGLPQWDRQDPRRQALIDRRPESIDDVAHWARETYRNGVPPESTASTMSTMSTPSTTRAEIAANGALVLIAVVCALLDRQLDAQAARFEQQGGFTERLHRTRRRQRDGDGRVTANGEYPDDAST
jgi:four helix bundle suffix protein